MKHIVFAFALVAFVVSASAQKFVKYYDEEKTQKSVEGQYSGKTKVGDWTLYHPNGKVYQQGSYDNRGDKVGVWKTFYDDGSKCAEETYGNGTNREWHRNGKLKSEVAVADGKKNGTYKSWYNNGK
ncbi:MAG: hypothetical protein IJP95_03180, partial [Bacteroidales bacterium]|nr:hypothetical protein [Bacteroidales bacterium]